MRPSEQILSHFIKVSHHGSLNSSSSDIWSKLFDENEQKEITQLENDLTDSIRDIEQDKKRIKEKYNKYNSPTFYWIEDCIVDKVSIIDSFTDSFYIPKKIDCPDATPLPPDAPSIESYIQANASFIKLVLFYILRSSVSAVKNLQTRINRLMASLETEKLPPELPQRVFFIKDNKLPDTGDEEHKRVQLPLSMAEDLANTLDLMDKEMAQVLTISIRTYHRLKKNGLLSPVASERLAMLKELADYGLEVFEDQDSFNQWIRLPLQELSNRSPLNSLETVAGFNQVKAILSRIEYGVYS